MMLDDESVTDLLMTIRKDNSVDRSDKLIEQNDEKKSEESDPMPYQHTNQSTNTETNEANKLFANKMLAVNDVQSLVNNEDKTHSNQNLANKSDQPQQLILVIPNGDYILIQDSSAINNQSVELNNVTNQAVESKNVSNSAEQMNDERVDDSNEESLMDDETFLDDEMPVSDDKVKISEKLTKIQLQHKARQQSLMLQLERLREKHKNSRGENEDQQSATTSAESDFWEFDETNEFEKLRSNHKSNKSNSKRKSIPIEKFCCEAKWYPSFCYNLEKAHNYVKRRSENIEQLSKYFTTTSYAFETRCTELRKHLKKLELNLERFQNVLGKDLHFVENKLKDFFKDYHLEQFQAQIEEEDQKDLEHCFSNHLFFKNRLDDSNYSSQSCSNQPSICENINYHQSIIISKCKNNDFNNLMSQSKKIKLVTPSSITITPTDEANDEIDPVPENRDVECDASLEEMGELFYSNNTLPKKTSHQSVTIRTKKLNSKNSSCDQDQRSAKKHRKI